MDDDFKRKLKKELEDILKNGFKGGLRNDLQKALKAELEDILKTEFNDLKDGPLDSSSKDNSLQDTSLKDSSKDYPQNDATHNASHNAFKGSENESDRVRSNNRDGVISGSEADSEQSGSHNVETQHSEAEQAEPKKAEADKAESQNSELENSKPENSKPDRAEFRNSETGNSKKPLLDPAIFEALAAKVRESKVNNSASGEASSGGAGNMVENNSESGPEKSEEKPSEKGGEKISEAQKVKNDQGDNKFESKSDNESSDNKSQNGQKAKSSSKKAEAKGRQPEVSEPAERKIPKHLTWKVLDNFDKIPDNKLFYVDGEDFKLSHAERERLRPLFKEVKDKYLPELEALVKSFQKPPETHLVIAGGNYTFYFILPHVMKLVKEEFRHLQIKLTLFEDGDGSRFHEQNAHIILSGNLISDDKQNAMVTARAEKAGYMVDAKSAYDAMYFAASKRLVKELGGVEETLKRGNLILERYYVDSSNTLRANPLYSFFPEGRRHEEPRVTVDQYYMKYLMMKNAVGIGHIYKTMPENGDDFVILDPKPFAEYKRYCLVKKGLNRRYVERITQIIIDVLNGKIK
jgi:hypothetical protein